MVKSKLIVVKTIKCYSCIATSCWSHNKLQAPEDTSKSRLPWLCHGPVAGKEPGFGLFGLNFQDFCEQKLQVSACRWVGIPQPGSVPEGKGTGSMVYTTTCDVYLSSYSRTVLKPPKESLIPLCFNFFLSLLLRWYFLPCPGTCSLSCSEKKRKLKSSFKNLRAFLLILLMYTVSL